MVIDDSEEFECPWCELEYNQAGDFFGDQNENEATEIQCNVCANWFKVFKEVTVRLSTIKTREVSP